MRKNLHGNTYAATWQATSAPEPKQALPPSHASWRISAGQLALRGPSRRRYAHDAPSAVFSALQRLLVFLRKAILSGKDKSPATLTHKDPSDLPHRPNP